MRMPVVLDADTPFPPVEAALAEPAGLLAIGGDLSLTRLRSAYRQGIFPWYAPGEPLLWWSPDPRMVLFTDRFAPSHSLRKTLRRLANEEAAGNPRIEVRVDTAFDAVMMACASPRDGQAGSWITRDMRVAYGAWHRAGGAHSVETWIDGELAGGLYGIGIGRTFFGESMFTRATDASKIALAYLVGFLRVQGVPMIDCQQATRHLASLGGGTVPRSEFRRRLVEFQDMPELPWQPGVLTAAGALRPLSDVMNRPTA